MSKLDPRLKSLLRQTRKSEQKPTRRPVPARVSISVQFTGDIADLKRLGFEAPTVVQHPTERYWLAAGTAPPDRLEALAAIDHVVRLEAAVPLQPELDVSVPEINANQLHQIATIPFKGAGVVVGIIDTGIDYRHGVFCKPDGTTRILALWDQSLTADPALGESAPTGFGGLGVQYNWAQINAALTSANPLAVVRTDDEPENAEERKETFRYHGTHVAGIAAGDGSQAGNCHLADHYVGVAPEADLILVRVNTGDTDDLGRSSNAANAMDYIFNHPDAAGKPVVINISLGDNLGPHDGTSMLELFINVFVLTQDGRAVVKSAGNEGSADRHVQGNVPPAVTVEVEFEIQPEDNKRRMMQIWYPGADRLDVRLEAPGLPILGGPTSPVVHPGDQDIPWTVNPGDPADEQIDVTIDSDLNDPVNNDNRIAIEIDPGDDATLQVGTWKLRLTNAGATGVSFHAWLERESKRKIAPRFLPGTDYDVTSECTISIPGTALHAITVGSYSAKGATKNELAASSSRGPTRDGRRKPDIAAPGVGVTSARAWEVDNCCSDCCEDFYRESSGTSQAAPHVTGVVALMLQRNRNLSSSNVVADLHILGHLTATARAPDPITAATLPNNDWGAGKVDAFAAVMHVPAPIGGGAPHASIASRGRGMPPARERELPASADGRTLMRSPAVAMLRRRALETPSGQLYAAVVSRHFSEVRGLINSNRRIAVAWHRAEGPRLLRSLLGTAADAAGTDTQDAAAQSRDRLLRFFTVLKLYASPALQEDITHHGDTFASLVCAGVSSLASGRAAA